MPEPFNGSGDFEDFLGQFSTAAYFSGWYCPCLLEGRSPIETASCSSAGVNQMTNRSLPDNTAIFDKFVRSLKRDTNNMPHIQNRRARDNSRSGERDRNNSMDRRSQTDSRDDTRSRYGNYTRDTRNTYMPSRNRQDNPDDSRQRY